MRLNRAEAAKIVGHEMIANLAELEVDFTSRVTDGTKDNGYTEFSATIKADDGLNDFTVTMYALMDTDTVMGCEDLSSLDWDQAIADAEFEIQ